MDLINFLNKDRDDILEKLLEKRILYLTGLIDCARYDLRSAEFVRDGILTLSQKSREPIKLIINSPGGEISSTLAIANTMRNLRHPVVTFAPGGAYSGAALILSAGTKGFRYVSDTTIAMIHGVQLGGFFYGGQKEYEETLEIIKKYNQAIINFLHKTTGQTKEKLAKDLMGEKWLVGEEIISYGLADKVIP